MVDVIQSVSVHADSNELLTVLAPSAPPLVTHVIPSAHGNDKKENQLASREHPTAVSFVEAEQTTKEFSEDLIGTPSQRHRSTNDLTGHNARCQSFCTIPRTSKAPCTLSTAADVLTGAPPFIFEGADRTKCCINDPRCNRPKAHCSREDIKLHTLFPGGPQVGFSCTSPDENNDVHCALSSEVSKKEYAEDSPSEDLPPTLGQIRRKNCLLMVVLLATTTLLAIAGGMGVGYVNKHFSTLTHRRYLEASEKVILNSSTMTLKRYHQELRVEAHNLMSFMRLTFHAEVNKSPKTLLNDLSTTFFDAWRTWMFRSTITTLHSVYIPLCEESQINTVLCLVLAVRISCESERKHSNCLFMVSNLTNRAKMDAYQIDFSQPTRPEVGHFVKEIPLTVDYVRGEGDQHYDFQTEEGLAARNAMHTTLVLRQQKRQGPYMIICDTGSSFDRWFESFEKGLQKTTNSYSMLFRDDGIIMAYGYEVSNSNDEPTDFPCHASIGPVQLGMCGVGKSAVLDRMVGIFLKITYDSSFLKATFGNQKALVMTENMDNYIVVYQDFLRFQDDYTRPHSVFFAAYAVPLEVSLSREGVFQIVICVLIIIICVFLLGGVAMVAVNQMLHVVEVISKLSTHAAMYDTEGMRSVLDQQKPGLLARLITSADVISYEFQLILANLNAYRPFLPQSLLTRGNGVFHDEAQVPPCATCGDDSGADLSTDHVEIHPEKAQVLHMSNALARTVPNPIENTRLLQRGFHPTKSTILVVSLANVAQRAGNSVDVVTVFVQTALNHAVLFSGVVETIEFHKVVISFNSHFSVPRHQEKACLCALAMREAFGDSGCVVSMGIASGYNYVGTTGTEQQKARVIVGESVVVAEALTHLSNYLGSSILATDPVVFEALVVAVAVDVIQIYYQHDNEWVQYSVSEIIGNRHAVLSSDMQLVKSVFKLVRYRKAAEALSVVRSYVAVVGGRQETPSWPVRRIHALVESQQELIRIGYRRRRQQWPALEGEELIINHLAEANRLYDTRALPLKGIHFLSTDTTFPGSSRNGHAASSEACLVTNETSAAFGEAALARVLMDEQSKLVMTLQQPAPLPNGCLSDNALFSVFMLIQSEEEDEERDSESITSVSDTKANDVHAGSDPVSAEMLPNASTLPFRVRNAFCTSQRLQLAASYPSLSCAFSETEHARRPWMTASFTSNSRRCLETWPLRDRTLSCLQGPTTCVNTSPRSGLLKGDRKRVCPLRDSKLVATTRNVSPVVDVAAVHGGGQENFSLKTHNRYTLPQRVVSISGQVFHRTTQLLGRGSFGEVYLVMSETGALGAMKAFPLYSNNAHQLVREVKTLSQMRHENIVGYDCCAVQDNFFFIICEYMAAGTLGSLIQKLGVIPEWAARKYARDVLFGIIYLHQHSWLHCDIKPENILIACDGTCKLADFGDAVLERSLTDAVSVRGTPRFSAPEAILGTWKEKADIYSFGITVAQMVMGVHPWHRYPEPDHLFVAHYAGEIRHSQQTGTPCMMQPELPMSLQDKELQSAIHRCCEFDPDLRPTAEELATLLS